MSVDVSNSAPNAVDTGNLQRLEFVAVTAITREQLPHIAVGIAERRRTQASSYGAYVIRGGGEVAAAEAVCLLLDGAEAEGELATNNLFVYGRDFSMHHDGGDPNSSTIHWMEQGQADMIVLPEATSLDPSWRRVVPRPISEQIFGGWLDVDQMTPPTTALRTTLQPDDVTIFDHSQFHAFNSLTTDRQSIAYYLKRVT